MNKYTSDGEFLEITGDILNHFKFDRIKEEGHHGITRYEHSLRVAYRSYKIAKRLKLDYTSVARAGLLHDFFFNYEIPEDKSAYFNHPDRSLINSMKYFNINDKEQDIIKKHMFPLNKTGFPKYKESWVVSTVDTAIATIEFASKFKTQLKLATNLFLIFLFKSF